MGLFFHNKSDTINEMTTILTKIMTQFFNEHPDLKDETISIFANTRQLITSTSSHKMNRLLKQNNATPKVAVYNFIHNFAMT